MQTQRIRVNTRWLLLATGVLLAVAGLDTRLASAPAGAPTGKPVRNIVLMIADGCGFPQMEAVGLYLHGAKGRLSLDQFPVKLGVSTYCATGKGYDPAQAWADFEYVKKGVTDSAAAATAMATGVKTRNGYIAMDPDKVPVKTVLERAEELGRATGVVTTVQFSHATPAAFLAHNPSRNEYEAIAQEMLLRSKADVIMGCGHPWYRNDGRRRDTPGDYKYVGGEATWAALTAGKAGGDADGDGVDDPWTFIETRDAFRALATGDTPKRVCGVAQVSSTLQLGRPGDRKAAPFEVPLTEGVPTLADMVRGALNVLDNDPDGFVVMIEGGSVDGAGHGNLSGRLIEEGVDFLRAVDAVVEWVNRHSNWDETVLIITADHETGYLSGPGSGPESQPMWKPLVGNGVNKLPGMEWYSTSHTNSLVPLYARGRAAEALTKRVVGKDPVRGDYIDNTEVGKLIFELLQ